MQIKRGLLAAVGIAVVVGLYFYLRPRTVWWTASDGVYKYELITNGPWIGEGYDVYLQGKTEKDGKLVYLRRLLVGLDTNGIPGFAGARLDTKRNEVIIRVAYDGGLEIPIPIHDWKGDWRGFLAEPVLKMPLRSEVQEVQ